MTALQPPPDQLPPSLSLVGRQAQTHSSAQLPSWHPQPWNIKLVLISIQFVQYLPECNRPCAWQAWSWYLESYVSDMTKGFKDAPQHVFRYIMVDIFNQQLPGSSLWSPHRFWSHWTRIGCSALLSLARLDHHWGPAQLVTRQT